MNERNRKLNEMVRKHKEEGLFFNQEEIVSLLKAGSTSIDKQRKELCKLFLDLYKFEYKVETLNTIINNFCEIKCGETRKISQELVELYYDGPFDLEEEFIVGGPKISFQIPKLMMDKLKDKRDELLMKQDKKTFDIYQELLED